MNALEKLRICREIRVDYQAGEVDVVTATVEIDEILAGGGRPGRALSPILDFLEDELGVRPGAPFWGRPS